MCILWTLFSCNKIYLRGVLNITDKWHLVKWPFYRWCLRYRSFTVATMFSSTLWHLRHRLVRCRCDVICQFAVERCDSITWVLNLFPRRDPNDLPTMTPSPRTLFVSRSLPQRIKSINFRDYVAAKSYSQNQSHTPYYVPVPGIKAPVVLYIQ